MVGLNSFFTKIWRFISAYFLLLLKKRKSGNFSYQEKIQRHKTHKLFLAKGHRL